MAQYWSAPNASGSNNFVRTDSSRIEKDDWSARIDHNFTDANRFYIRYSYHLTPGLRSAATYGAKPSRAITPSPTIPGTLRGSWSRLSNFRSPYSDGFDPATLGCPRMTRTSCL